MEDISRSITKFVNSKEYFVDVRVWYIRKYVNISRERSILVIWLILLTLLCAEIYLTLVTQLNAMKVSDYAVYIKDTLGKKIVVHDVDYNNPDEEIAKIIAKHYIRFREEYDYSQLNNYIKFVWNLSSENVFKEYYSDFDINDPESKLQKFRRKMVRRVHVSKIDILPDGSIKATYKAELLNVKLNKIEFVETFEANIMYTMPSLDQVTRDKTKFVFKVIKYNTTQIYA